jgi:hypothetical protein
MKITAMTVATMLGVAAVQGQSPAPETRRSVTVCLHADASVRASVLRARASVSQVFASIGLAITWRDGVRDCAAHEIRVDLRRDTPVSLKAGVLAYARPYEGTDIQVFYGRISGNWETCMVPVILAHVLAHEITHILEGIDRHSQQGIMKAHWDARDYFQMRIKPLEFAPEDIEYIEMGLASRSHSPIRMAKPSQTRQ